MKRGILSVFWIKADERREIFDLGFWPNSGHEPSRFLLQMSSLVPLGEARFGRIGSTNGSAAHGQQPDPKKANRSMGAPWLKGPILPARANEVIE
jgi:hypothetical protein